MVNYNSRNLINSLLYSATLCVVISALVIKPALAKDNVTKVDAETLRLLELFGDTLDKVKKEYVTEVSDKQLIENALNGMLSSLDPHSSYLNEEAFEEMKIQTKGEFGGLGLELTMENGIIKVISPIDDTPAFKEGVKSGDYIISINDEPVMGLSLAEAVKKMRGPAGTNIKITVIRDGKSEPIEFNITRAMIKVKSVKVRKEGDIAYLRINSFSEQTSHTLKASYKSMVSEMKNIKGVVLDLRNNPGGLLDQAVAVTDLFLDEGEVVYTKGRHKESMVRYRAEKGDITNGLPIIVLINGGSASASEIVAGALQDNKRALVMGTNSFGKGSVQSVIPTSHKGAIRLTTALYYTPSGRSIQAEGIVPDIVVEPAKLEMVGSDNSKKTYSEASLKGHLPNEKHSKDKKDAKAIALDAAKAISSTKDASLYEKDYQLARAIDLLKAMAVLKVNINNNLKIMRKLSNEAKN
jgi:carboxyl-terminal processing protease